MAKELTKAGKERKRPARKNEGRPVLYSTPAELQKLIDKYFQDCKNNKSDFVTKEGKILKVSNPLVPCIAGCAHAIGMDRSTFYDYELKDEFSYTIKKARNYIISTWESKMVNTNANAGGIIFAGKNYGYNDTQKIQHSGSIVTGFEFEINTAQP